MIRNPKLYKPADKDNAYHSAPYEWWYFDGVFDNGYSIWTIWFTGNAGNRNPEGRSLEFCLADPNGMVTQLTPEFPLHETSASTKKCDATWGGNYVRGRYPKFEVHYRGDGVGCDLVYENTTQGVREPPDGCFLGRIQEPRSASYWTHVIHPRSKISGYLIVGDEKIPVKGEGYFDHQWGNMNLYEAFEWWYWGRIYLPKHTIQYFDGDHSEKWGHQRFKRVWLFKGAKPIDYMKDGIYTGASDIDVVPIMRITYARNLLQTFDGEKISGTVTHKMKHMVRPLGLLGMGPEGSQPPNYMAWVCECNAKLEIDGEKIEAVSNNIHERSVWYHAPKLTMI